MVHEKSGGPALTLFQRDEGRTQRSLTLAQQGVCTSRQQQSRTNAPDYSQWTGLLRRKEKALQRITQVVLLSGCFIQDVILPGDWNDRA